MDILGGKRVDRSALFDDNGSDGSDIDNQDFAAFEKMMDARVKAAEQPVNTVEEASDAEMQEEEDGGDLPVFKLFAGSQAVKVETKIEEVVYTLPERPQPNMEESDTEEHWEALRSAAVDSEEIKTASQIRLPAMVYPKRVIHKKPQI
ncbi:hypothetical protein GGI12_000552 [Dipsacomyces acuminosporus]|nr:hypothetical protein GGI12_000552 [Dipsacomyces acuminosporus]